MIKDGVAHIGQYAFYKCSSLTNITIPDSVTSIGYAAFSDCSSLTNITIPDGVTSIDQHTFFYCSSLTSITIPDGVTSIGDYAFYDCNNLTSITIPDSVTSIGGQVFYGCSSLANILVSDRNATYCSCDGILFTKSMTTLLCYPGGKSDNSYEIPSGVTSIGQYAFYKCSNLTSIIIPDSVTSIGYAAFSSCSSLTSITIPDSVTYINARAFYGCSGLADVYYSGSESDWDRITIFDDNFNLTSATIHYNSTGPENLDYKLDFSLDDTTIVLGREDQPVLKSDVILLGLSVSEEQAKEQLADYTWTSGNESVVKVKSAAYTENRVCVSLDVLDVGEATITAINSEGKSVSCKVTVEPEIVVQSLTGTLTGKNKITCTVSLENANTDYLTQFMEGLQITRSGSSSIKGGGYFVDGESAPIMPIESTDHSYQISEDGKSAVCTVYFTVIDRGTGSIVFLSPGGVKYTSETIQCGGATYQCDLCYLGEDGTTWYSDTTTWENGSYNKTEFNVQLTVTYQPGAEDKAETASLNQVSFALDHLDMFKISGNAVQTPNVTLNPGESYSCTIKLVKNGLFWKEPESAELTGKITATIDGDFSDQTLPLKVFNQDLADKEAAAAEQDIQDTTAEDVASAVTAFNDISDKIAFDAHLGTYFTEGEQDAIALAILTEVAVCNMDLSNWRDSGLDGLSKEISEKIAVQIMNRYLGYWDPGVDVKADTVPVSFYMETEKHGKVLCQFTCKLTRASLSGTEFGFTGSVASQITLVEEGNRVVSFEDGIINSGDIKAFADSAWSIAASAIKSGYREWSGQVDNYIDHLSDAAIEKAASTVASYGLSKPAKLILKRFYQKKLKGKFTDKTFEFLCYPSKMAIASCPVNVFVYNSDGTLVGSIEENTVTSQKDGVLLWTDGDTKYIQMFGAEYKIVYKATGKGTMKLQVYDQTSGTTDLRVCTMNDISLDEGVSYTQKVDDITLTDSSNYNLTSNKDTVVEVDEVSAVSTVRKVSHTISFDLVYTEDGYPDAMITDETVKLVGSLPNPERSGYKFVGWFTSAYNNDEPVDDSYIFTENIMLYAHWEKLQQDLNRCTVSLSNDSYTYDGRAKAPTVMVKNGSTALVKNTDYTVSYQNNTNVGAATVTITGKGDYTGTVTKTFKITQAKQTITAKSYTKTLGDKAFSLGAKTNGGGKLTYKSSNTRVATVSSSGKITLKGVGSAKITITAAATKNYKKATKTITITVNPTGTKLSSVKNTSGKKMKVTWKKNSKVTGYQIQYSTSSKFKSAKTVTVKSYKTTNKTISKLTKKKKYYVRIRTYKKINGKSYYSNWSGSKSVTIKK